MRAKFYAFDDDGNQMLNLSPTDFELTENGEVRTITDITCPTPQPPFAISSVLVFDVSSSMKGSNIEKAKLAAKVWIDELPVGNECAITSFDSKNYLNMDFTNNKSQLLNAVDKLTPKRGTNYNMALLGQLAGGLAVSKKGENKKIIVFLTDGLPEQKTDVTSIVKEAKNQNCIIYCVTLGIPSPQALKEIADQTGGLLFDNISTSQELETIYRNILLFAQGNENCNITWQTNKSCIIDSINLELKNIQNLKTTNSYYIYPENKIMELEFSKKNIRFLNPIIGNQVTQTLTITARNTTFNVSDIISSNPAFSITPTNFTLLENQSIDLLISYTALDSSFTFSKFTLRNDICEKSIYISGGIEGVKPEEKTLKLVYPNGGEEFVVGTELLIAWEGISPNELFHLSYSIDNGTNWIDIDTTRGLSYNWVNIPKAESQNCIVRVIHLEEKFFKRKDSVLILNGHQGYVSSAKFNPDGSKIVSASRDKTLKIWDSVTGSLVRTLIGHTSSIESVAYSPDGKNIASSAAGDDISVDNSIKIWDSETGDLVRTLIGHSHFVMSVAYSSDGRKIVSASYDSTLKIWDSGSGALIRTLTGHSNGVLSAVISPDGSKIVSGAYDKTIMIWDAETGDLLHTFNVNNDYIRSVDFSPDGNYLAAGGTDENIKIWDFKTGKLIKTLEGQPRTINEIKFSPNGKYIASVSESTRIILHDVETDSLIRTYVGHKVGDVVMSVAFNPIGNKIVTGSMENTIRIWNFEEPNLQLDQSDNIFSIVAPKAAAINIDLGQVFVNDIKDSVIDSFISNIGEYPLSVNSIYFQGADADAFSLVSGIPKYRVEQSNTHFGEFRFSPKRAGLHTAIIVVITQSDTLKQSITAEGIDRNIEVVENLIDFGKVNIGEFKDTLQEVTIKNVGSTPFTITETNHSYPNDIDFTTLDGGGNFTLQPDETRKMELRFAPSNEGRTSGVLEFHYDGVGSPAVVQLFGEGIQKDTLSNVIQLSDAISIKSISPNPATNNLEIVINLIETGKTELSLYNSNGEKIKVFFVEDILRVGERKYNVSIGGLASGKYFVVLKTPTITENMSLIIY